MSQSNRLPQGGQIDRQRHMEFQFDGKSYSGFAGDTLASALLANDVKLVGRSFKYHRPRGIVAAGWEEPNAMVQLESGARTLPNTPATVTELYHGLSATPQNCWPSLSFDVGALNSVFSRLFVAGFYYKTFKWPAFAWESLYEKIIRRAAGMGIAPPAPDPDHYEHFHAFPDILVVGAGPAGLMAARNAAASGARVLLLDDQPEAGGSLHNYPADIDGRPAAEWLAAIRHELLGYDNLEIVPRTQVVAYHDHNYLLALERVTNHLGPIESPGPRERLWKIRAKQVVIATGAIERPLVFADNDRPGVMLASAVRTYLHRYAVRAGQRVALFTNNDTVYPLAEELQDSGAQVIVVDVRARVPQAWLQRMQERQIRVREASAISGIRYKVSRGIYAIEIHRIDRSGQNLAGGGENLQCDLIGSSGGWNPAVHLHTQARGKVHWDETLATFLPATTGPTAHCISAGGCHGSQTLQQALQQGAEAGLQAVKALGLTCDKAASIPSAEDDTPAPLRPLWCVPTDHPVGQGKKKHFVDPQNDATVGDVQLAAREGFDASEHLKRYTNAGRGTDQGKSSNINTLGVLAQTRGLSIPEVGLTTFRPPYTPLSFGAIVGEGRGEGVFAPIRTTPMHAWHVQQGAAFEDVGEWKRAHYYPKNGEDMHAAVARECLATRYHVGIFDGSTLGKIDIQGPDSSKLLNMLYTNAWSKLAVGKCRYGLMCNELGMVIDDGVTTRIGENHYHMTTTTGGAARVLDWIEEWLQTEWPEMEVFCTSVTEQWAVIALAGPKARDVLSQVCDIDLSAESFPFMSYREAKVAGVPARLFRISFSGELGFEINVPARYGKYVWEQLYAAGQPYHITPYGTETMHVLRAELGFIIVGQETDGTTTPQDLGMDGLVSKKKDDNLGRRGWSLSHIAAEGRKQLVGLRTEDPMTVIPEGTHIVAELERKPPMKMLGHVTSSYYSANCGHSIALALLRNGRERMGEWVHCVTIDGQAIQAQICAPSFIKRNSEGGRD